MSCRAIIGEAPRISDTVRTSCPSAPGVSIHNNTQYTDQSVKEKNESVFSTKVIVPVPWNHVIKEKTDFPIDENPWVRTTPYRVKR